MTLHKKILAVLVVTLLLIIILLGGLFLIFKRAAEAPTTDFKGPNSVPYATGPSGPPPSSY